MHPKIILTNQLLYYKLWEKNKEIDIIMQRICSLDLQMEVFFFKKNIVNKINNYRNTLAIV